MGFRFFLPFALSVLAFSLAGCSLLYDPCGDLETRLCDDLGAGCGTFRGVERIHDSVIPLRRRQAERSQCEMLAADENYASYTLPYVRYQVEARSNPSLPMPRFPRPKPAGLNAATASYYWYALPFVVIPGMLVYSWFGRRKLLAAIAAAQAQQPPQTAQAPFAPPPSFGAPPPAGAPAGPWDHVDSRLAAEQLARTGALVPVQLVPSAHAMPENVVYLPPPAAARMNEIAQQVEQLRQGGHTGHAIAEPTYRGPSCVPCAIVVRFGERAETVHVW